MIFEYYLDDLRASKNFLSFLFASQLENKNSNYH
jgi:hypothetical protein